jgi:hypothetical protein
MIKIGMLEPARSGRFKFGAGLRILGLLVLGGSAASAAALIYPPREPSVEVMRSDPQLEKTKTASAPHAAKVDTRLTPTAPASPGTAAAPAAGAIRQIPLISGVDPTPPAPPKVGSSGQQVAAAASPSGALVEPVLAQVVKAPTASTIASSAKAPVDCLPEGLRVVLQDVQARFGQVTLVSTRELHTDNHSPGSARHRLHSECKAVDFKTEGDLNAVAAYLRSRPEVAGVNSYRNNRVIHIDAAEGRKLAQR